MCFCAVVMKSVMFYVTRRAKSSVSCDLCYILTQFIVFFCFYYTCIYFMVTSVMTFDAGQ